MGRRVVSLLLALHVAAARSSGPRGAIAAEEPYEWNSAPFDYLMFTQIYPASVCRADDDTVPDSCEIPKDTPEWTIHGLWPNYKDGSYPQFCDDRKFDAGMVAPIRKKLELNWPNLFPTKTVESFWKHEWEKHGTCAKGDDLVDTEINYFNQSLSLHSRQDVFSALAAQGIHPSAQALSTSTVEHAASVGVANGRAVQIHCLKDKKSGQWLLGDVRVCVDWTLQPLDCPEEKEEREKSEARKLRLEDSGQPLPGFFKCPSSLYYVEADTALPPAPAPSFLSLLSSSTVLSKLIILCLILLFVLLLLAIFRRRLCLPLPVKESKKKSYEQLSVRSQKTLISQDSDAHSKYACDNNCL